MVGLREMQASASVEHDRGGWSSGPMVGEPGRATRENLRWNIPVRSEASARNVAVTAVVAGDAVMTDADQSRRQNVPGESADELDGAQSESFERGSA